MLKSGILRGHKDGNLWMVDVESVRDRANNPRPCLLYTSPAGIRLNIFTVEKAITKMPKILELNENIMMVFGTTKALVDVCKATGAINEIQYGATFNKDGSKQIDQSVFLDESEQSDTRELLAMGVKLYSQQTPSFPKEPITSV